MQLDIGQINNLCTGVKLAVELKSDNPDLRKFLTIQGYSYNEMGKVVGLEKTLKSSILNNVFFEVRCYEISVDYYINGWDVTEEDLTSEVYIDDIEGIEALEIELSHYLEDYSILKPEWYCENLL